MTLCPQSTFVNFGTKPGEFEDTTKGRLGGGPQNFNETPCERRTQFQERNRKDTGIRVETLFTVVCSGGSTQRVACQETVAVKSLEGGSSP